MFFSTENSNEKPQGGIFFRRIFRRVFLDDWILKAVALAITLGLWLGVTGFRAPVTKNLKDITLNLNFPNNFENTKPSPQKIEIIVTGDKRKVDTLRGEDLIASIDLTDVKPGDQIVNLTPDNVNIELPSGVKIDDIITPKKFVVQLEKVVEREVEVKPVTEGNLADGFEIYSETVMPPQVKVRGAESVVKSLDSVMTEKINIENRNADFVARQIGLNVVNPNATVLDGIVDVAFKIGEKRVERVMVVPFKTERETKKATVVLYGARSILESLRVEDLKIEMVKSDNGEMQPQLILPPDIQDKIEVRQFKFSA
ncbi:MAG: CdaR family protein [Pyrinomonadaceae bacterium]